MKPDPSRRSSAWQGIARFLGLLMLLMSAWASEAGAAGLSPEVSQSQDNEPAIQEALPVRPMLRTGSQAGVAPDPEVQQIIDRVTPTLVYSYVAGLSGEQPVWVGGNAYTIQNRNTEGGEGIQTATQYAFERFAAAGLQASYQDWTAQTWKNWTDRNVIGEQPGELTPERIFMLVAHLDDYPFGTVAPGADDNASGSAAVLIAAQLLSGFPCHRTLRFVLFTGEEQGLLGSRAYAKLVVGQNIEGVLNLDMIGWESNGFPEIDLYARPGNGPDLRIARYFVDGINDYGLALAPEVREEPESRSDHYAFWRYGFPAVLAIEDMEDFNKNYHSQNDRLANLDLDYLTNFVKAAVGAVAHAACQAPSYNFYLPVVEINGIPR